MVGAVFLATSFTVVTRLTFAHGNATGGVADAMVVAVVGAAGHIARIAHETTVAFAFSFDALAVGASLRASLRHAVGASPSISTHAFADFLALGAGRKLALTVGGIAPFRARFPTTVFAGECRRAFAFEVIFLKAFAASTARVGALANGAIVSFKFRVTLASVSDTHTVA